MMERSVRCRDGVVLRCATTDIRAKKPWIMLLIPFGLKQEIAESFFDFFEPQYNVVTWESRVILRADISEADEAKQLCIQMHVEDVNAVACSCDIESAYVVGYCSGAGVALAATKQYPNLVDCLILVHGEYTMLGDASCTTQFAKEIDSLLSLAAQDEEHLALVFNKIKGDRFEAEHNRPNGIDVPFSELHYFRRYALNYLSYKSVDYPALAKEINHDALVMAGGLDLQANVMSSRKINECLPNSKLLVDPDADHYGILREDSNTLVNIWNYLGECRVRHA